MGSVLFLMGTSRGGALNGILSSLTSAFRDYGLDVIPVDLSVPDIIQELQRLLDQKQVLFAFGCAGIGRDLIVQQSSDGKNQYLWEILNIPFISSNGDSPAYFFDRHINPSPNFAIFYAFREHYEFRKNLPLQTGMFAMAPASAVDAVAKETVDFKAKETGKLIFLKNGGSPNALKARWKQTCSAFIYGTLCQIGDVLAANIATDPHTNIDALITDFFKTKGLDVDSLITLRLFFVAQLDDYLRRVKCQFMAEVLKDFPVEIHGDNWDFMDFSDAKCRLVPVCDFEKSRMLIQSSLGIIDMSPNTGQGFHDRPSRAFGRHTLCLTNEQECFSEMFGEKNGLTFNFNRESLSDKIADVLARPKQYVELGSETSRIFNEQCPHETVVQTLLEAAEIMRIANHKERLAISDYFIWPPEGL